ncbi:MAG: hypothetical protein D3910_18435 [Candidatus Electrothrix sp. ATG2]|nr:hypothetical protein [Candidatus Electrothrix sp. ATG2]
MGFIPLFSLLLITAQAFLGLEEPEEHMVLAMIHKPDVRAHVQGQGTGSCKIAGDLLDRLYIAACIYHCFFSSILFSYARWDEQDALFDDA